MDNEAKIEFEKAIQEGRLSLDKTVPNYVGYYMYMGKNSEGKALFKHSLTREYLKN